MFCNVSVLCLPEFGPHSGCFCCPPLWLQKRSHSWTAGAMSGSSASSSTCWATPPSSSPAISLSDMSSAPVISKEVGISERRGLFWSRNPSLWSLVTRCVSVCHPGSGVCYPLVKTCVYGSEDKTGLLDEGSGSSRSEADSGSSVKQALKLLFCAAGLQVGGPPRTRAGWITNQSVVFAAWEEQLVLLAALMKPPEEKTHKDKM